MIRNKTSFRQESMAGGHNAELQNVKKRNGDVTLSKKRLSAKRQKTAFDVSQKKRQNVKKLTTQSHTFAHPFL